MPTPKVREVLRRLNSEGWVLVRQRGSHRHFKHPDRSGVVTVAGKPGVQMDEDMWRSVRRQAGWE